MKTTIGKIRILGIGLGTMTLLAFTYWAFAQTPSFRPTAADLAVMVDTNGALLAPTNFFSANAGLVMDTNALHATNNLADVSSAAAARANLGIESAGTYAASAFQPASSNLTNWAAVATNQVGQINASQTWSGTNTFSQTVVAGTNLTATNGTGTFKYLSFATTSGTPAIVTNSGAGTGASASITAGANDVRGVFTVATGSSPSAGAKVATVLFSQAKPAADAVVILTPASASAANVSGGGLVKIFATNYTSSSFEIWATASALTAGQTWSFQYLCVQ